MITAFGTRLLHFDRAARGGPDADDPAAAQPGAAGRGTSDAGFRQYPVTSGRWFLLIWLLALIILAANDPGRMFFDTKLGVDIDAAGFYAHLWHLWNPLEWFGTLQNQYVGYAFPMAPFYLVGQLLHVPTWIIERIWLSLLVAVGYAGLVRLAAALRIGSERSRLLAGLVFALWPSFTIIIGSTSAAVLPGVLAPWAVLPLVSASRRGSVIGAAARSGVAVLCMGGVNAVATLDALVLPALFILTHTRGRRRVALAACWSLAVALATSWWTVPLLLQGRYSFDFLPYIEQATTTTATMSAAAFLRGAGNWTAYLNFGTPWITAGWAMIAAPAAVLASAAVAAVGLAGVARRDMPEACWLRLSMGAAALVALAGYGGPLGGPFHVQVQHLLDGGLAPFRNVYKVEQVLAVALALGLAHALARDRPRSGTRPGWSGRLPAEVATVPVAAVVLAGLALPYLSGQVLNPGSFTRVPGYWYQVADYLASRSPQEPALVVPADSHGTYLWGDPIDDPLEPLARSPWVERGLVPYGGAGSQIFLQTAESAVESGEQVPGLAAYLERAGVRFVVVRNDLDPAMVGYTPPPVVHETLELSGFRRVAAFGPRVTGAQTDPRAPPPIQNLQPAYPSVEVYAPVNASHQPAGPATLLPVSQTVLADGGPGALLQLAGQNIIGTEPVVTAGDRLVARPSLWAVTDALRRADNAFGLITSTVSYTYTATETNPVDDPLGGAGGPPRQLVPASARGRQTVAVLSGAARVTASSAGSWLGETTQYDPVNAFDRNPATAWAEGVPGGPVGQWIQINFDHQMSLPGSAAIRLLDDGSGRSMADHLEVSTAAGRVSTTVAPTSATQQLRVPPGPSGWLRITITGARGGTPGGPGAGVSDVLIPGIRVTRFLQPAQDAAGLRAVPRVLLPAADTFSGHPGQRGCLPAAGPDVRHPRPGETSAPGHGGSAARPGSRCPARPAGAGLRKCNPCAGELHPRLAAQPGGGQPAARLSGGILDCRCPESGHPLELAWRSPHRRDDPRTRVRVRLGARKRADHEPRWNPQRPGRLRRGRPIRAADYQPRRDQLPHRACVGDGRYRPRSGQAAPGRPVQAVYSRSGWPAPAAAGPRGKVQPGLREGASSQRGRAPVPDSRQRNRRRPDPLLSGRN